jgi:glycosyltransferase involved in cell wall biosynthesis
MKLAMVNNGVYYYASGSPHAVGGAERQQFLLARALVNSGWSVTVGVRGILPPKARRVLDGLEFVGLDQGQPLMAWYRFLASERPHWWYWRCAYHLWGAAVEVARLTGVRTIFSTALDREVNPRNALFWRRRWWPLYAWGLSRTDRIFVQHRGQLTGLPKRWQGKAYVVPSIAGQVSATRSLREPKRPDLLIQIAREMPNIRFIVCGGPSSYASSPGYGERIVNELRNVKNIEFHGAVSPDEAERTIAQSAVFLCTATEEGFPNTFLQAWASGTPVVSLNIDPDGLVKEKGLGIVAGSVSQAVNAIQRLVESPEERNEIADRARQHVAAAHSDRAATLIFQRAIEGPRC